MSYETQTALAMPTSTLDKVGAALAHGSVLLGVPFVLPLCTLLFAMFVQPSPYLKTQSIQALAFHFVVSLIVGVLLFIAGALGIFGLIAGILASGQAGGELVLPANWGLALLVLLLSMLFLAWASIMALIATIKAFQGKPYRYPLVGGLV